MDMVTEKTIEVDGKPVKLKATARTPRLYRLRFGRDMMQDMSKLQEAYNNKAVNNVDLSAVDLTLFENIAYTMNKQGDPDIPDDIDEWLDGFGIFSIYQVLPEIFALWQSSLATTAKPKKK